MVDILGKCGVPPMSIRSGLKEWRRITAISCRCSLEAPIPSMRCIKTILEAGEGVFFSCHRDRDQLIDLCDRLLDLNPKMRPTTHMILLHPFLKDIVPPSRMRDITEMKQCDDPLLNLIVRNKEIWRLC